mmetsp:Transcript_61188/g.147261  ORF Transcript_61188/g.147261 Transcript_61188/m.147261 type:complete len:203 (+) Transcript_61188:778-1386(+)
MGCILYCTWRRMGFTPLAIMRSKMLCVSPAFAAFLHMTTGPSWQWSPTNTICLAPITMGMRDSGSVACVHSSRSTFVNLKLASLGSPAPTHVVHMTSAAISSSFSVPLLRLLYFFSSPADSSPCSLLSCDSFLNSLLSDVSRLCTWWCSVSISTFDAMASLLLAAILTTLSPVMWIFSAKWSTATLEGAVTSTCPCPILARW